MSRIIIGIIEPGAALHFVYASALSSSRHSPRRHIHPNELAAQTAAMEIAVRYVSTRGASPALNFDDVTLAGLAPDGGLYVPESWPTIDAQSMREWQGLSYPELAVEVMAPFVEGALTKDVLRELVTRAYGRFDHRAVAPLKQLGAGHYVLELFHGPTLAFKDYALQFVGHLFDHILHERNERVTIVGATSGDTGSAAIEACKNRSAIDIFILHPRGRVSDVQRRQMTTVDADNVYNVAIDGNFDDCQDLVKALFADESFRDEVRLSAVNSINWARILAQIVYYFWAALQLGAPDRTVGFGVPTGNFGNIFAGYCARKMGLPIDRLVIGSNKNDILTRFMRTGEMSAEPVVPSLSPSMDIQVSSNFERLLFELQGRDGARTAEWIRSFRATGRAELDSEGMDALSVLFGAQRYDDRQTADIIQDYYQKTGELFCPHSAIGVQCAVDDPTFGVAPRVALATAHPAKFPAAVEAASGMFPALPEHLADLFERSEQMTELDNDMSALQAYIRSEIGAS